MGRSGGAGGVFSGDTYFGSGRPWVDVMAHGAKGDGVTDDTVAVQAAINTAGITGEVVFFPPGKNFSVSFLTPVNGLVLSGYGATITQIAGTQNAIFYDLPVPPATKSGFECYGLTFVGEGTGVTEHQQSAVWLNEWNDVTIRDCVAKNFASGAFQGRNVRRWKVVNNSIFNCCKAAGRNAINFADQGTTSVNYLQDLTVTGNYVTGTPTPGIAVGLAFIDNSSIGGKVRAVIANNIITAATGWAAIDLELSTSGGVVPTMREVVIANNVCNVTATVGSGTCGINVSNPGAANDITIFSDIVISGNQITSTDAGIRAFGSGITVTGNTITCNNRAIQTASEGSSHLHLQRLHIADNTIHTTVNPNLGLGLIEAIQLDHSTIVNNRIVTDTGNSASTVSGIYVDQAGWFRVADNQLDTMPAYGIRLNTVNDFEVLRNRVYNCNDCNGASVGRGIFLSGSTGNVTGVANLIVDNHIVDDRGTSQTQYGIYVTPAGATNLHAINNVIFGTLTASTTGTMLEQVGTRTTAVPVPSTTYSSALVTATNASWPIPGGATVLRVTAVGGGGGGGGGGSSSAIAGQAGGSGGSSGVTSTQVVSVGANTTLSVTVGGGGGGGNGGAASGNLGNNGSRGTSTTVTGTGISVTGLGGGNGTGSGANSATQVFSVGYGANVGNSNSALQGIAGTGAGGGNQGGAAFDYSGGAGGGGGTTSATLGGGAGGAGTATVGGAAGTTGTSGTTAGVVGGTAGANTGAGGGGGGGGAWNGGTGPGAGGNGGTGGSGYVVIEVLG